MCDPNTCGPALHASHIRCHQTVQQTSVYAADSMPDPCSPDQLDDNDYACAGHVGEDRYLQRLVSDWVMNDPGASGQCAFCSERGMPVDEILTTISDGVDKFFDDAEFTTTRIEENYIDLTVDAQEVLWDLCLEELNPLFNASVEHLGNETRWVRSGYGWPSEQTLMRKAWQAFSEHVRHRSRFLFETRPTQNTWGGTDELGTDDFLEYLGETIAQQPIATFGTDTELFRARPVSTDSPPPVTADEYTSPPLRFAAQGRMNPAGIAYFYGALEPNTAAVEVYAPDSFAAVATFTPVRPLQLVNLTGVALPSPFDPTISRVDQEHRLFLTGFIEDISRPIIRDQRVGQEYVPTQAVTEYIRFRSDPPVDGVMFNSAQVDGTNVVIFANQRQCLGPASGSLLTPGKSIRRFEFNAPSTTEGASENLKPAP